jgi:hypothetical protein
MSTSNRASSGAPPDDPWEQLAEQLFGTECGKEHAAADDAPKPNTVECLESESPAAGTSAAETPCAPPCAADAGIGIPVEEMQPQFKVEEATSAPAEAAAAKPANAADSYWDALANFSWDEPVRDRRSSRGRDRSGRHAEPAVVEPQQEIREVRVPDAGVPAAPGGATAAELAGSEGLIWDSEEESATFPPAAEKPPVAGGALREPVPLREEARPPRRERPAERAGHFAGKPQDDDEGKGRRRRRRRRRDKGDEDTAATAASAAPLQPEFPGADWDEPEANRPRSESASTDALPDEPDDWEPEGVAEPEDPGETGGEPELSADDDESGDSFVSYANVPTWEEAISYLLHPEQVQPEASAPQRGPAPQQPEARHSRHYGKKHRR